MNFSEALELLKQGKKLQRKGWNGKNQMVVMQKGYPEGINANKNTREAWDLKEGELFIVDPYLQLQSPSKRHSMWVPSINDLFAEDWRVV